MANNKKNKNVSNANSHLYELARKGAEARAFRQGQTVEQLKRDNANQINAYNSAIDKYKKNGSTDKKTVSSLQKSFSRTSSYFSGDASTDVDNDYSAVNLLSKQGYKNFVKSNNEMRGVASQLLNNYNDKKEFENYKHNRSNRERQSYRENQIAQAEGEYKNKKSENRYARRQALLHMFNDKGQGEEYEKTRTTLANSKLALDDAKQWNYSETQAESLKTLQNDKELSKMIDIAARRKITKGIKTIDQTAAKNTSYADDVNEYITWKNYKKKLLNDGYTEKEIDNLVNARLAEINGEAYEGAAEFGKHAPVLAETFKLATAVPNEIANFGYSFDAAKGNTVVNPYSTASAGIKKGVGEYASKNGVSLRGLFDTKNNNILKVNDNNELIVFGKNQGDINKALYENIDQSATNIINSLVFGGGVTGGIIAKGASEKLRQAVINTAFSSGTMGEQLAEQLYNGDEVSSAYKSALKDATVNWMSEMLGSPIEWANVNPKSTIGRAITSGVGEGLEEIIGNAMDRTWDATVNGKASEISQKYQEYIKNGKTPKEATDLVLKDMVSDDLFAAMSAGVAGFAMGGVGAISESVENKSAKKLTGTRINANYNRDTLISEAKNIDNAEIKELVAKAENAKTEKARSKTLGNLATAVQQHLSESHNDNMYNIVYEAVKNDSKSKEVAHQVADSIVNGSKPKNSSAKNYVHSIKNNDSRLAKRINDKLGAENYGATVRQQYVNDMTERHVGDFDSYTKGLATPQQLYEEATQKHNAEFKQQNKAMNDVAVKHFKKMEALVRLEENSQENIAKENESLLSNDTKNVLKDSKQVTYEAVSGISSVDNGVVILDTKDGKKTVLQNVDFGDNKKAEQLFKFSSFFGDGAKTFVTNYFLNHDGEAPADYFDKAKLAYKSGMERIEYSKVFGESTFGMTEEEAQSLYKAGLEQSDKLSAEIQNVKATKGKGVHVVGNVKLSNEQTHQLHFLSELVKGTSAQILVANSAEAVGLKNTNGYIDGDTIVVFAKESDKAVLSYAGHELTHYIKDNVPKEMYSEYHDFVIEHLKSKGEEHYNEIAERYAKAYGFDTDTQMNLVEEEMVADNALAVFSDEKALNTLAKDNRTLLQKVHDFFKQFAEKLKEVKQKLSKSSVVYSEVNHDIDFLEQSAEKIREMLDSVKENTSKQSDTVKYSIKTIIDEDGTNYGKGVYLDSNILDGLDETARKAKIVKYINALGGQGFYATDKNGEPVLIEIPTTKKFKSKSGKMKKANGDLVRKNNNSVVKLQTLSLINETIELSKYDGQSLPKYPHGWLDDKGKTNWEYYTVFVQEKNKTIWNATLNVATSTNGKKILYDISPIKKVEPGVKSPATTINSISKNQDNVNKKFSKNTALDAEYENGTEQEKEKIIQNLAMKWGAYSVDGKVPLKLYHGTENFGFTEFDLDRMDDKISIFLTDDITTAQTYSGTFNTKKINERNQIDVNKLSNNELIDLLNEYSRTTENVYEYSVMDMSGRNDLISKVNDEIEWLKGEVTQEIEDFNGDDKTIKMLHDLKEALSKYQYDGLSTKIYMLLHHSEAFRHDIEQSEKISQTEQDIRLMNLTRKLGDTKPVIVEKGLDGYSIELLDFDKAKYILKSYINRGNYSLYAKLNNPFVVDAEGHNWNDITYYENIPEKLKEFYPHGLWRRGTTRSIAKYAYNQGFDSVVFKNIIDNGSGGRTTAGVADNIVVVFDNKMVKSADTVTYDNDGKVIPPSERFTDKSDIRYSKNTSVDSEGNELTNEQQEYFKDSKVRDEDGNLLVVYHGSYEDFTVFDKTKGRANMDIQGSFFSPWEIDAGGYGPNVKAYYLNITNPADEQTGYKALKKYQGQSEAGIKAREYLESLGYDGVNNGNEEYIAFNSNQIKLIDNAAPTAKSDIRYSKDTNIDDFDVKRYNEVWISDKSEYAAVMSAIKMSDLNDTPHFEIRKINTYGKSYLYYYDVDDNPHIVSKKANENYRRVYNEINDTSDELLESIENDESRYRNSKRSYELSDRRRTATSNDKLVNREIQTENPDNGTGYTENDGDVDLRGEDNRYSRNTRLNYDENFDDVNEAFEQALNVLQNIKGIDVSSKVVDEIGKAQRNIDKELDGYHAQKMRNSNSVNKVARNLKEEYASSMPTGKLTNMLADLYDYMANGDSTDMAYINSQAKVIANELINSSTSIAESDYKDIRKRITDKSYSLTPEAKKSLTEANGSWREARQSFSSQLRINPKSDMSIERLYTDLSTDYPDLFDSSIVDEQEMLYAISDFVENNADTVVYNYQDELEQQGNIRGQFSLSEFENVIAGDIYDSFFDIEQVQSAIDKLDNKYKAQIASMREEMNDQKSLIRQQYRENYENKLAEYKNHAKDVQIRKKERKDITVLKNRIRRLRMQIDRKLLKPSGNNYVPKDLVQSMAKVCDMLVEADMSSHKSEKTLSALTELKFQYANLQTDPDYDYASEYSQEVENQINDLYKAFKGRQLNELSKSEMQNVYDIVKGISKSLQNAKTLIDSNLKTSAHQSAVELIKQQSKTKGNGRTPFGLFDYGLLNSMRYVNLISEGNKDGVLNILFDELNRGARKKDFLTMKWQKPFENLIREDHKSYREFREKLIDTPFVNVKGETVQLAESQIVQLIMSAKREQGRKHLAGGGFVAVDTKRLLKGKSGAKTKGNIVENTADTLIDRIVELTDKLSPYAQKWMSLAENLFNNEVTSEVNNTSFMLKGYKIANEKYYIPLMADKDYTATQLEGVSMDKTIENAGFTKAVNVNAGNRIVIDGIDQVINRHIDTVSNYVSLAVPIRNFNKVWNGQTSKYYDSEFLQDIDRQKLSVKEVIKNKWGDRAAMLIENTVSDLQSSRTGHSEIGGIYNKILSNEISATFLGNLSIVLKQAASYPTAAAVLSSDSLLKGSKGFAYIPSSKRLQALFDEIDEHTGAHYKRRIGMQTEELAALMRSAKGFQGKWLNSKLGMLHPAKWIQAMDVQTTAALWIASKYEIEKSKKFTEGSSEYWQAVTDLYDEVIEYTQPEYDVLHRAEIQKNTNPIARTFSLFQTQPLQNSGILYDGYREVMWAKQRLSEDNSEVNKEALKQARTKQRKAVWAITSASATFAAFSFIATFLVLHKTKKYRDDDDDVTAKSVLSAIGKETAETILSAYLPILGSYAIDIGSRISSMVESGSFSDYDYIDNMGLSAINDFLKAGVKLAGTTGLAFKGDKTFKDVAASSKDLLVQVAQMNGVPATNTLNLYNSVTAYYKELIKHDCDLWDYNTQSMSSKELLTKYVEYKNEGNGEKAKEFKQKWFKSNSDKTENDFNSYIASYLAENEPKIAKAVQYRNELNTSKYENILDSIIKKGYAKEIVDSAAQSVETKVKSTAQALFDGETDTYNDGIADLVKRGYDETSLKKYIKSIQSDLSESDGGNKVKGRYSTDELYRVWNSKGENSAEYKTMYNDILNTKVANGMDKETAEKRIKSSIVDNYMNKSTDLQMAQKAYDQGNMQSYQYYINRVIATGKLSQEEVVKKARGNDPYKKSLWSATDYDKAIDQNDKTQADKIFKELCKANGDVKSERQYVRGSTTSYFRKKYLEAKSKQERSNIVAKLRKTGFYTQSEINNLRRKWDEAAKEE